VRAYLGVIEAASVVAILLGLFMLGHHFGAKGVQAKWDANKVIVLQATATAEAKARATEQSYAAQLSKAQNDHTVALQKSQKSAAVATARVSSLRDQLAASERLAAAAQGHADDSLMCQQAWPR
jgi:hypothetical protein